MLPGWRRAAARTLLAVIGTIISVIVALGAAAWLHEWGVF